MAMSPQEAAAAGLSWVDEGHPLYGTPGFVGASSAPGQPTAPPAGAPSAPPSSAAPATPPSTPDPFAAMGGGVFVNGGWVPKTHPLAQQASAQPGAAPAPSSGYYGGSPTGPQPYNATPAAQSSFMDTLAGRMTQDATAVDRTNPAIRAQADAFAANVDRQRRNLVADQAERLGPYGTGALAGTERMAAERAGQVSGAFEADLVGREIQARRDEVAQALQTMSGVLSDDQKARLAQQQMQLDAELRRLGIGSTEGIANRELDLKRDLGFGGLNLDASRLLLQNQQFGDQLGFDTAAFEADYMRQLLGF